MFGLTLHRSRTHTKPTDNNVPPSRNGTRSELRLATAEEPDGLVCIPRERPVNVLMTMMTKNRIPSPATPYHTSPQSDRLVDISMAVDSCANMW